MYINLWYKFGGHPENVYFFFKFLKILMDSDKAIHTAIRIHKTR